MKDFSVLMGGKAGFGIDKATLILGHLLNQCGYRIYIYHDYPSLIRGGHTFSLIRAAGTRVAAHRERIDLLLALNRETFDRADGEAQRAKPFRRGEPPDGIGVVEHP